MTRTLNRSWGERGTAYNIFSGGTTILGEGGGGGGGLLQ